MSAVPDDLEKLLGDVRKTIAENERFVLTLMEDVVDDAGVDSDDAGNDSSEADFEEL